MDIIECEAIDLQGFDREGYEVRDITMRNITFGKKGMSHKQQIVLCCCEGITFENLRCYERKCLQFGHDMGWIDRIIYLYKQEQLRSLYYFDLNYILCGDEKQFDLEEYIVNLDYQGKCKHPKKPVKSRNFGCLYFFNKNISTRLLTVLTTGVIFAVEQMNCIT